MKETMIEKLKEDICDTKGTLVIIFINIVLFISLNIISSIENKLLLDPEMSMIIQRPWTLVTVFFSHELLIHILLNMVVFFFFGSKLEKITNSKTVVIVYLIAGLIGSLAFPVITPMIQRTGLVAGASAAVFGVVTAFAVMRPSIVILKSKAKLWIWALVIFSVLPAILIPQTLDSAVAHVAGIFVGLISGYFLKNKEAEESK